MEVTRNQTIIFKEKCDFSHSTLESVECNMADLTGRGRDRQMWTGFSQYVTRAYLSHSLNGTKA